MIEKHNFDTGEDISAPNQKAFDFFKKFDDSKEKVMDKKLNVKSESPQDALGESPCAIGVSPGGVDSDQERGLSEAKVKVIDKNAMMEILKELDK